MLPSSSLAIPNKPVYMNDVVYARLSEDGAISDDVKKQLLELCVACSSESEVIEEFDKFSGSRRRLGPEIVMHSGDEVLGHLKNLHKASSYLAKTLSLSPADVENNFRLLGGAGTRTERDEAELWFEEDVVGHSVTITVSGPPCWLFREESKGDAKVEFASADVGCLPARAGLPEFIGYDPYPTGLEFIGYTFLAKDLDECRAPTFLDGSYGSVRDIWITGGRSQPIPNALPACVAKGGLIEVVTGPPPLKAVSSFKVFQN